MSEQKTSDEFTTGYCSIFDLFVVSDDFMIIYTHFGARFLMHFILIRVVAFCAMTPSILVHCFLYISCLNVVCEMRW